MSTETRSEPEVAPAEPPRPTLVAQAIERLRAEIIAGALPAQQKIPLAETARRLGMSPIPLREALRALTAEGWVISSPQRGYRVSPISEEELDGIYDVRVLVEPHAAFLAAKKCTSRDIDQIQGALVALQKTYDQPTPILDHAEAHQQFHFAIYRPCGSPVLLEVIERLWQRGRRYQEVSATFRPAKQDRTERHRLLASAAIAGDADGLAQQLTSHLVETNERLRWLFTARTHTPAFLVSNPTRWCESITMPRSG